MSDLATVKGEISRWTNAAKEYQERGQYAYDQSIGRTSDQIGWQLTAKKDYELARFYFDAIVSVEDYAKERNML